MWLPSSGCGYQWHPIYPFLTSIEAVAEASQLLLIDTISSLPLSFQAFSCCRPSMLIKGLCIRFLKLIDKITDLQKGGIFKLAIEAYVLPRSAIQFRILLKSWFFSFFLVPRRPAACIETQVSGGSDEIFDDKLTSFKPLNPAGGARCMCLASEKSTPQKFGLSLVWNEMLKYAKSKKHTIVKRSEIGLLQPLWSPFRNFSIKMLEDPKSHLPTLLWVLITVSFTRVVLSSHFLN